MAGADKPSTHNQYGGRSMVSSLSRGQWHRPDWTSSSVDVLHVPLPLSASSRGRSAVMVRVTDVWRICRTETRRFAFRFLNHDKNWRRNLAITYAVSVWSMIGFVAYMQWQTKDTVVERPKTANVDFPDLEEDPSQRRKQKFEFSAVIDYKENHVPYTTRIYQYFMSTDKKSDGDSTKN
ncbi:small integral membrane protein 26 [Dendrobates tinctorius]|uniref:small integral membrane protein 26 n=1 Tax=Dendrobates tinctorius TaxID=92724 RepID=UPI003CCA397E